MKESPFPDTVTAQLQKIYRSPAYQQNCQRFQAECQRLEEIAQALRQRRSALQSDCNTRTVRRESASGSDLHRGFYCPSPVVDVVVGNTHRGKILKRVTRRSNPSHEYGFDANGQLLWCTNLTDRTATLIEYLVYEGNAVYGIKFDSSGYLHTIAEEVYRDGKLTSYIYGLCLPLNGDVRCLEITCEYYDYDEEGLCSFQRHTFMLPPENTSDDLKDFIPPSFISSPMYRSEEYSFQRENGFLSSYSCGGRSYPALVERKA